MRIRRAKLIGSLIAAATALLFAAGTSAAHADDTTPPPAPTLSYSPADTYWGT